MYQIRSGVSSQPNIQASPRLVVFLKTSSS
jgi:hypothetical protein